MEAALNKPSETAQGELLRRELGPTFRALASRYFEPVRFASKAEQDLGGISEQGFVVHVMRTSTWVNYLYLTWALVKHKLPPLRAAVNLRRWLTRPWRRIALKGDPGVRFTYARRNQGSSLVFLRRPMIGSARGRQSKEDPFPALVAMARKSGTAVYLVPELFVWEKASQTLQPRLLDYVIGSPDAPGPLYTVAAFLRNYRRAQFRVGEPIDLKRFVAEHPNDSDAVIARKVRSALHHHLARESRAVFGPPRKSTDRLIEETLRDRTLRRSLEEVSKAEGRPLESALRQSHRHLKAIAARFHPTAVALAYPILKWVFNRIYAGIEVDEPGLDRAMKAATRAPVVFCPSHKSHIDYLVMAYVLWSRGYSVPLVAAGANLSFFPLGAFFRRGGAFFLRRSFKGDPVYTATFKAYLKKLVRDGIHQEFFPEGGRSRTGKLLPPKLGILTWEVEAVLDGARNDLNFVPVAIDYERVVETGSYCFELGGGEKKAEDLKALLAAPRVLASRYGLIHLSFDDPISLAEFIRARGGAIRDDMPDDEKKALVQALGHRIMYSIDRASTLTPHALVSASILAHRGRGVWPKEIVERVGLLRRIAVEDGRRVSSVLENAPSDPTVLGPIQEAMNTFVSEGMVQSKEAKGHTLFLPVEERRPQLAYYKNSLMNLMASPSLVASAVLAAPSGGSEGEVRERALFLSRLFKFEFIYRVGSTFDLLFSEAVEKLVRLGLVLRTGGMLSVAPEPHSRPQLFFIADLLRDYLGSYLLAALTLQELAQGAPVDRKAFVRAALDTGRAELLAGHLQTPESISQTTVDNAVTFLLGQQMLKEVGKKLWLGPAAETVAARASFIELIRSFLRPP